MFPISSGRVRIGRFHNIKCIIYVICYHLRMIILGIDPGTAKCGWGIIEKNDLKLIDYGCIETSKDSPTGDRLKIIQKELRKIIKRYKPKKIGLESLFFFKNQKTAMKVAQAYGVIILTITQEKIPIIELTPLQVKQGMVGYGRAEKSQVQKMVQKFLKLKEIPKPDDAADALAVAICASYF